MPPPSPSPAPRRAILAPWQRASVRALAGGFVLLAGGGLFLLASEGGSAAATWTLLAHLVVGVLLVPVLIAFALPHAVVHAPRRPVIGLTGALVLLLALTVALTGALLAFERAASPLRGPAAWWLHVAGGFGILLLYVLHRRRGTNPAPWSRLVAAAVAVVALGAGLGAWERAGGALGDPEALAAAEGPEQPFLPSLATTGTGRPFVDSSVLADVSRCGDCHPRITEDWRRSAHRHASMTNPFYRGTIEEARRKLPLEDSRWCAGCHDPALLFTGKWTDPELDLRTDPDAMVGLTCLSCHAIEVQSVLGNGHYVVKERTVYPWERSPDPRVREAHDVLLRAKPDAHVRSLRPANVHEAEFCSVCHKAEIPPEVNRWKWFRAQDEYDAWHDSGVSLNNVRSFYHPPAARSCRDCHMPLVPDPQDPAADRQGQVRSHLFAAANTALPFLRGDDDMIEQTRRMLRTACRVDLTAVVLEPEADGERRLFAPAWRARPAVRPGEVVEVQVVVRNQGVGHAFPGGTIDSNEVWVRFEAAVGDAPPFYLSGDVDPATGHVDPSAEHYRAYVMDREGNRVVNRLGTDVYTRVQVRTIGPGTADVVRYRIRVPEDASTGTLRFRATLRYRKFMRPYVDRLFPDGPVIEHRLDDGTVRQVDLANLPIVDLAEGTLDLPVTPEGTAGPAPDVAHVAAPEDLLRVNDLGIAYLLQMDPAAAEPLFVAVTRIDPTYADGWVNVGRARIALAAWAPARAALAEAARRRPGWAKPRFFEAEIARRLTEFPAAEQAYRDVLATWPKERMALKGLATVLYEQDRFAACLEVLDRLFEIDPEDWMGWFLAVRAAGALGDDARAAAAEAAFDRFRPDDDEPYRRGAFLLADPNLERLEQKIHVHEAPEVGDR